MRYTWSRKDQVLFSSEHAAECVQVVHVERTGKLDVQLENQSLLGQVQSEALPQQYQRKSPHHNHYKDPKLHSEKLNTKGRDKTVFVHGGTGGSEGVFTFHCGVAIDRTSHHDKEPHPNEKQKVKITTTGTSKRRQLWEQITSYPEETKTAIMLDELFYSQRPLNLLNKCFK